MIYVSEEFKQAFLSAEQKNLVLTFDDGTVIDNDDIALESMNLEQTLCDNDELRFGKVSSACFKTKITASTKTYKNLWFSAKISVGEYEFSLGKFKVYTDNMTSDRLYRDIVAYDALFWATNTDVTEWYNGLEFPISQKDFRDSLFDYLEIEQEVVDLPSDSIILNRTSDVEGLTGLTVLQKMCEINATWGVINNEGKFKYVRMRSHEHDALYPSDDLFPSDELFPNDIYDDSITKSDYYQGSLKYEEYDTQPITMVTIRENAEDVGFSVGTEGNTYVIENNFLLYGATDETLQAVASNFHSLASYITYTPAQLKCKGAPWREVGDLLRVVADKRTLAVPILNRQISGITALNDTYVAKGTETYGELKNSPYEQIKQLQGRTNKLTRDLNGTRSEVSKKVDGKDVVSVINQSAEAIELSGNRLIVDSTNFKLDENGNVKISGNLEAKESLMLEGYTYDEYEEPTTISFPVIEAILGGLGQINVYINHTSGSILRYDARFNTTYFDEICDFSEDVFMQTAPQITSDRDKKKNVKALDKEKSSEFIYSLKPCQFKYIKNNSNRLHHGFIAQEVKEIMGKNDWGVYVDKNPEEKGNKALRYEELIADLVATIQSQNERIKALEERLGV